MEDVRRILENKRTQLIGEMQRLSTPPESTGSISFGKRVGEGTSMAVDRLQEVDAYEKAAAVLAMVERALAKQDQGTYGKCDSCGDRIPNERLEALPWATRCVKCASATRR